MLLKDPWVQFLMACTNFLNGVNENCIEEVVASLFNVIEIKCLTCYNKQCSFYRRFHNFSSKSDCFSLVFAVKIFEFSSN